MATKARTKKVTKKAKKKDSGRIRPVFNFGDFDPTNPNDVALAQKYDAYHIGAARGMVLAFVSMAMTARGLDTQGVARRLGVAPSVIEAFAKDSPIIPYDPKFLNLIFSTVGVEGSPDDYLRSMALGKARKKLSA